MIRFRFWLAVLLIWLGVLFNLERLHEPINLASFVYVLACCLAVSIVVVPPMRKATLGVLAVVSLSLLVALKVSLGYGLVGEYLTLTVTESTAILITVALAHQIARHARRFEVSAADVATARWQAHPRSFDEGQADMYRELRRARRFERPLTVISVEPTPETLRLSVDRLIEEVRGEMVRRYVDVRLADALRAVTQDFDLVANHRGRFILLLPEADKQQTQEAMKKIARRVNEDLGLQLRMGTATFPQDEVTLTGLVERAESTMTDAKLNSQEEEPAQEIPHSAVLNMQ